jgi:photosynthetic reaction center cytochrome c subunit
MMKVNDRLAVCLGAIFITAVLLGAAERSIAQANTAQADATNSKAAPRQSSAQAAPQTTPQTAGQKFKNLQVLKEIPADQLIPTMQFIAASLGVECEFCHVEHAREKDDKKTKLTARKMMTMMMEINAANFKGDREVTCYTCHHGSVHPVGTPILSAESASSPRAPESEAAAAPVLPTAQAILDKYLAAVGGADALLKIKTRVQTGNLEASGKKFPIEIYSQAPDKRASTSHMGSNPSVTAYNGETGWLSTPHGIRQMTPAEQLAASIDAQLYFPARLPRMYQEFQVSAGEVIDLPTYVVSASGKNQVPLDLYFDQSSGLLVRLIRYAETALGRNPTQIDYADYRVTDGLKLPYRWTLARTNGRFTIQIDDVKQNVPVDGKLFVMPSIPEGH